MREGAALFGSVLFGADEEVARLVRSKVSSQFPADLHEQKFHSALGVVRRGKLIGGVVYFNYRHPDIEVSAAFDGRDWASRETLKILFGYPFVQLGCVRATAYTARKNRKARNFLERIGCKVEGVKRLALDGKQDLILYGLLRKDCTWLGARHG